MAEFEKPDFSQFIRDTAPDNVVPLAAERDRQAQELQALRDERLHRIHDSGICITPQDAASVVDDKLELKHALQIVQAWTDSPKARPVLILCGGVGTGKTVAAAWAISRFRGRSYAVRAPQLAQRVDPWRSDADAGYELVPLTARFLVLDDLGTERDSKEPRFAEALGRFADERQGHGRTIITSNLQPKEFRERYDTRVIDRLNQCARVAQVRGTSMRKGGGGL